MAKDPRQYKPPEIVGDVDAVPPPMRKTKAESVYDPLIEYASEREGRWAKIDPAGRNLQNFRNGIKARAETLGIELAVRKRGKFVYIKYDGEGQAVRDIIAQIREESRATYGD
jgi:hypothetical protein